MLLIYVFIRLGITLEGYKHVHSCSIFTKCYVSFALSRQNQTQFDAISQYRYMILSLTLKKHFFRYQIRNAMRSLTSRSGLVYRKFIPIIKYCCFKLTVSTTLGCIIVDPPLFRFAEKILKLCQYFGQKLAIS